MCAMYYACFAVAVAAADGGGGVVTSFTSDNF